MSEIEKVMPMSSYEAVIIALQVRAALKGAE